MRPDFGSGLLALVFEPGGPELAATTQHLVQGALQFELGHLIAVDSVEVSQDEGTFSVTVSYVALRTQERASASFSRRWPMRYVCCDERRLLAVKEAGVLNGIEYVEVSDSEAPTQALRQRTLFVRLLQPAPRADGRERRRSPAASGSRTVEVEWIAPATPLPAGEDPALVAGLDDPATVLLVRTDSRGDFSRYMLRLVAGGGSEEPPAGFDPLLASRRVLVQGRVPVRLRLRARLQLPARDRRVALDRLPREGLLLVPLADARPAQPARARVDGADAGRRRGSRSSRLLAYVADELSYRQDAVATEAYLGDGAAADVAAAPRAARRLPRPRGLERARVGARLRRR